MTGYGLTPRQRELLAYISEREICPTFEEMCQALGYKSKNGPTWQLRQLEERGYIRRLFNRQQAIEVIRPLPIVINGQPYRFIPKSHATLGRLAPVAGNSSPAGATAAGDLPDEVRAAMREGH